MKKLICFLFICPFISFSQDASMAFRSDSIVFYGLDFTHSQLIGDFGNGDGYVMKTKMFPQWNELMLKEAEKYNIYNAFKKQHVYYDFGPVAEENSKTDDAKILSYNEGPPISKETIAEMVKRYPSGDKKAGLGLVFIIDKFNKTKVEGRVHVTLFDIATKKVLFTEPMKGIPMGAGLRNYWARVIYNVLKDINMFAYTSWRSKYSGK